MAFQDCGDDFAHDKKTARVHGCPSNLDRCEASLEPKIAPVAPLKSFQMFSELKRLSKLMGSDIVLYQYISAILDLLGTVRLAKISGQSDG